MTVACRSWLPANTVAPTLAMGAIGDMVDEWSRAWFAGEPMRALGTLVRIAEPGRELRKTSYHRCEGGVAIGVPHEIATLGARVLGVASNAERTPADVELLSRVAGECLDDLKRRAAALFKLDKPAWSQSQQAVGGALHRLEIAGPAREVTLVLELSEELFARVVRERLPAPPAPPALGAASGALAQLPVRLSAVLGSCGITIAELADLTEGDVLVLDRTLDARLPLAVQGVVTKRGSCTLSQTGDTVALKISEALAA